MAQEGADFGALFREGLKWMTLTSICNRKIILTQDLLEWWAKDDRVEHFVNEISNGTNWTVGEIRTVIHKLSTNSCLLLVFSLLLQLREGHQIDTFIRCMDSHTAFQEINRTHVEAAMNRGKGFDEEFVNRFERHRWPYHPIKLNYPLEKNFDRRFILPIIKHKRIKDGSYASVWLVDIPAQFVEEELRQITKAYRYKDGQTTREYFQFAIKSLKQGNMEHYNNELDAFKFLKKNKNMISYLGEFQYFRFRERKGSAHSNIDIEVNSPDHPLGEYNILLEPAVCDLQNYLWQADFPIHSSEITNIWELMSRLVEALMGLHAFTWEDGNEYLGWHLDIKPDNILLALSEDREEWQFKLADPGCAQFLPASGVTRASIPGTKAHLPILVDGRAGGRIFGPPERMCKDKQGIYQGYDIWSLGCVFSLVATWIVLGQRGLHEYEWIRREARRQTTHDAGAGDAFHDDRKPLGKVREWHKHLITTARQSDSVTPRIIKMIDDYMLVEKPEHRYTAGQILEHFSDVLKNANQCSHAEKSIMNDLKDIKRQPRSNTLAHLFKLRFRNDLLIRLWQLPSYRTTTGSIASTNPETTGIPTHTHDIPLITVECMEPRNRSSLSMSKSWADTKSRKEGVSDATTSRPLSIDLLGKRRRQDEEKIVEHTRALRYEKVVELCEKDPSLLETHDENGHTLMDHLLSTGEDGDVNFGSLFRLFHGASVVPKTGHTEIYRRFKRKQASNNN